MTPYTEMFKPNFYILCSANLEGNINQHIDQHMEEHTCINLEEFSDPFYGFLDQGALET